MRLGRMVPDAPYGITVGGVVVEVHDDAPGRSEVEDGEVWVRYAGNFYSVQRCHVNYLDEAPKARDAMFQAGDIVVAFEEQSGCDWQAPVGSPVTVLEDEDETDRWFNGAVILDDGTRRVTRWPSEHFRLLADAKPKTILREYKTKRMKFTVSQ